MKFEHLKYLKICQEFNLKGLNRRDLSSLPHISLVELRPQANSQLSNEADKALAKICRAHERVRLIYLEYKTELFLGL